MYEIKVYKIWYADAPNDIYIGSTKHDRLSKRMKQHRTDATKGSPALIYRTMREKGVNNFEYCMLGSCMVSNKDEQRMFEQSYMNRLKPTLNMYRAYTSEEDYKGKKREQDKEYRQRPEVKEKKKQRAKERLNKPNQAAIDRAVAFRKLMGF